MCVDLSEPAYHARDCDCVKSLLIRNGVTHACSIHAIPGNAADGHHDGKVCLSEWKSFFDWATEHGEGEMYLSKVEKALAAKGIKLYMTDMVIQKQFDARVEAVFKALDADRSGELSLPEMERIFGEETHEFWEDMDGETSM